MNTINKRRSFLGLVGAWAWACHPALNAQTLCPKPSGRPVLVLRTSRFFPEQDDSEARDDSIADVSDGQRLDHRNLRRIGRQPAVGQTTVISGAYA